MNGIPDIWRELVLDDGEHGVSEGFLFERNGHRWIVADGGAVDLLEDGSCAASHVVMIAGQTPSSDLLGQLVKVVGTWRSNKLNAELFEPVERDGSMVRWRDPHLCRAWAEPALRHPAERDLMERNLLLGVWRSDTSEGTYTYALATNQRLVSEVLSGIYGENLHVLPSRWSEQALHEVECELFQADVNVVSFGRALGSDYQLRVSATLVSLPTMIAERLARTGSEMLDLGVLVRPG